MMLRVLEGWTWLDEVGRDVRAAHRSLVRSSGFTVGAILVLGLGIGVNLAAFQLLSRARSGPSRDSSGSKARSIR